MRYLICITLGYFLGTLSPAALVAKIKHKNIRKSGTGNLGATNVMLNFGKGFGAIVMLIDIFKGFLAVKLAKILFPTLAIAGMLSGVAAILGHIFPFYLKFKGGKGLAAFAGFVLAYDPKIFIFLLISGVALMIFVNYSFILPFYAGIAFPLLVWLGSRSVALTVISSVASVIIMIKHAGNIKKALRGEDNKVRATIKKMFKRDTEQ